MEKTENILKYYKEELTEAFVIVTIVKGVNVLCKTGVEVIKAADERLKGWITTHLTQHQFYKSYGKLNLNQKEEIIQLE